MILDELAQYLEDENFGTQAETIFAGLLPDQPDECIALFEYRSTMPPGVVDTVEPRMVQIRSRAFHYPDARGPAEGIYSLLHTKTELTLSGTRFLLILARQTPFSLGRDKQQRHEFAVNFLVYYDNPNR